MSIVDFLRAKPTKGAAPMATAVQTEYRVEQWPIDRPKRYPGNPRKNKASVRRIAASLTEYGWRQPLVVDKNDVIIVGDTRFQAAQFLGLETVPVHVANDLTDEQVKAYRLADNKLGELSDWDFAQLQVEMQDLPQPQLLLSGFSIDEIAEVLEGQRTVDVPTPDPPGKAQSEPGTIYELGGHRIACGDSRDPELLELLFRGAQASVIWTDPPYGVDYVGKTPAAMTIAGDDRDSAPALLGAVLAGSEPHVVSGAPFYLASPSGPAALELLGALPPEWHLRQILVWIKNAMVLGHSDYHYRHEFVGYGAAPAASRDHPTTKPVGLVEAQLKNHALPGAIVFDPFCGSGTTILAAESCGLTCYAVEIEPRFVDVIRERCKELV